MMGPLQRSNYTSKLFEINWLLVALISLIGMVGVAMIFAATGGVWSSGASQHFLRLMLCSISVSYTHLTLPTIYSV